MRLIQLRWESNPRIQTHPVFVDPDSVAAVYQTEGPLAMIVLKQFGSLAVEMPAAVIVEQLYDGYSATRH